MGFDIETLKKFIILFENLAMRRIGLAEHGLTEEQWAAFISKHSRDKSLKPSAYHNVATVAEFKRLAGVARIQLDELKNSQRR